MYIVMELCEKNMDLGFYIKDRRKSGKQISEREVMGIVDNILQGLLWLNKNKIMHRDIK